jgi:hypothetical protein
MIAFILAFNVCHAEWDSFYWADCISWSLKYKKILTSFLRSVDIEKLGE